MVAVALALAACTASDETPDTKLTLEPTAFADLPGWRDDNLAAALPAWRRSCSRLSTRPAGAAVGPAGVGGDVASWQVVCRQLLAVGADDTAVRAFIEAVLQPYRVVGRDGPSGLFTGYFEPHLRGSRERGGPYQVPLYARPRDHVSVDLGVFADDLKGRRIVGRVEAGRLRPFDTRGDIDAGTLGPGTPGGRAAVLFWVEDPLDALVLHIQGSGQIILPDGEVHRVGFAAHNGFAYGSVGRWLIDRGELAPHAASFAGIRRWLAANPRRAAETLAVNQRYIFFREVEGGGPIGADDVVLTAGRSLAVDTGLLPLNVPVWLDAEGPGNAPGRLQRLMLAQDTGAAITGAVRGDIYWGTGAEAFAVAERTHSSGGYYLLLPKSRVPPDVVGRR